MEARRRGIVCSQNNCGVSDIAKIATFLNYSPNTVNTYKTRAKKASNLSNDRFEPAIMAIRSVD